MHKNQLEQIQQFAVLVKDANCEDNELFYSSIKTSMEILEIDDEEFMHRFDMSLPSVQRWKRGKNAPHPSIRKHVYDFLYAKSKELLSNDL